MDLCPRCAAVHVIAETDKYGAYLSCLSCGWVKDGEMVYPYTDQHRKRDPLPEPNSRNREPRPR